jgi:serine/threonine protein phosphatase PrpC
MMIDKNARGKQHVVFSQLMTTLVLVLLVLLPTNPFTNSKSRSSSNVINGTRAKAAFITPPAAAVDALNFGGVVSHIVSSSFERTRRFHQSRNYQHAGSDMLTSLSITAGGHIRRTSQPKSRLPFITALFLSSKAKKDGSFSFRTASASVAGSDPDSPGKVNQDACFHFATICKSNHKKAHHQHQQLQQERDQKEENLHSSLFLCGGVLDGHGKKGHVLNQFLGEHLPRLLEKKIHCTFDCTNSNTDGTTPIPTSKNITSMEDILIDTFDQAHNAARRNETVPAARSGTTCVTCVVDTMAGVIYTANVGDSRAVLIFQNPEEWTIGAGRVTPKYKIIPLSTETTTKDVHERKRIEETKQGRIDGNGNVW